MYHTMSLKKLISFKGGRIFLVLCNIGKNVIVRETERTILYKYYKGELTAMARIKNKEVVNQLNLVDFVTQVNGALKEISERKLEMATIPVERVEDVYEANEPITPTDIIEAEIIEADIIDIVEDTPELNKKTVLEDIHSTFKEKKSKNKILFEGNPDFYPTPRQLVDVMMEGIDIFKVHSVLEPQAGKGDLVNGLMEYMKEEAKRRNDAEWEECSTDSRRRRFYYKKEIRVDVDAIEINENLRHILTGNGIRVVHDDFLTFNSFRHYDLVIMNVPFSEGDLHLLKALEVQKYGGTVIALLNAETIRNPYSNRRKELIKMLNAYNAEVTYIESAFSNAERATDVEVALVKVVIPKEDNLESSILLAHLKKDERYLQSCTYTSSEIVDADPIKGLIARYMVEVNAGVELIREFNRVKDMFLPSLSENTRSDRPIIQLSAYGRDSSDMSIDVFVKTTRMKYWNAVFNTKEFSNLLTSGMRDSYREKLEEFKEYDFSEFNIGQVKKNIEDNLIVSLNDTIISMFDKLSHQHAYTEYADNVHYFSGWKTNKSWKINKKVILPMYLFSSWSGKLDSYRAVSELSDIEKVLNYLDGGRTGESVDVIEQINQAERTGVTRNIKLKYFTVSLYKKGTCHITFDDEELLKKFNIYGARHKKWLPPSYGNASYEDMSEEERKVVDEFEGEVSYKNTMLDKGYYLSQSSSMLSLTCN